MQHKGGARRNMIYLVGSLSILTVIATIATTAIATTANAAQKVYGKKGSDERLKWCDAVQDGCHDVGCAAYDYGGEFEDPKGLIECYDKCNREYDDCMAQERRKGKDAVRPPDKGVLDPGPRKPPKLQPEVAPKSEQLIQ